MPRSPYRPRHRASAHQGVDLAVVTQTAGGGWSAACACGARQLFGSREDASAWFDRHVCPRSWSRPTRA